ncbi:DUF5709 domain-containing protein [Dactylosporangium sp. CA-139114]|uniref:DUF5709 domain-containing protein n=1 Tax=Dactylosporangium sp. CA-139114 TaxID=3239931 RepID=UPI003D96F825
MTDAADDGETARDEFPRRVSDPEALGLPDVADDDSTAWDDVESPRIADGPDPGLLPLDRDDHPLAIDQYGTTPEEARAGEPLELKLDREVPDPALEVPGERADAGSSPSDAESFDAEAVRTDLDTVDDDTVLDAAPIQPDRDSPVSMYDTGIGGEGTVGRLVEPDEGIGPDLEKDAIAYDAGAAGGGPSAEETAMHELPER